MILSPIKSCKYRTLFAQLELNLPSLLQNGRAFTSYNGAAVRFDKTQKSIGNTYFDGLAVYGNILRNFWLFSCPFHRKL